jgi:hypothetical protein
VVTLLQLEGKVQKALREQEEPQRAHETAKLVRDELAMVIVP